jgi:hypothetical protein
MIRYAADNANQRPWRSKLALPVLVLSGALLASIGSRAQEPDFDHTETRFLLTGSHENVRCEACHVAGVFRGTPTDCAFCHDGTGMRAESGKPLNHVPTSNRCADCHTSVTWEQVRFDHAAVTGSCMSCHDGFVARGKSNDHIFTSSDCNLCHIEVTWNAIRFDHSAVTGSCSSCHNDAEATGKPNDHVVTSRECDACHSTRAWRPASFDHSGITAPCSSCHNGTEATGKSNDHVVTSQECDSCHSTRAWRPASFDHSGITAPCSSCHDGIEARGKEDGHIQTSAECDLCHSTRAWSPATFDHNAVTGSCSNCHNGIEATGTPDGHFTSSSECDLCHTTNRWMPSTFRHMSGNYPGDHRGNLGCTRCHMANNETVQWPFPSLQPDCAACHRSDYKPGPHKKYENPDTTYTPEELRDCSGSCHTYTDSTLTTIKERRSGEHRVGDGDF